MVTTPFHTSTILFIFNRPLNACFPEILMHPPLKNKKSRQGIQCTPHLHISI